MLLKLRIEYLTYVDSLNYAILLVLLQCSVSEGDLHCQCILSIFPANLHQFYANILVFVNINPFLYTNDQFASIHFVLKELVSTGKCLNI